MNNDAHSEIDDLLPWYAAGTLSREDAQRVEAAFAEDPALASRYQLAREEMAETIAINEALGAPAPGALDALFTKIDAEPIRKVPPASDIFGRIGEFFASLSPQTLVWGATAAAFALILQAGVIGDFMLRQKPATTYQTASDASKPVGAGTRVLIRFAPQAGVDAITQFLQANKFVIVDGPSAGSLYTLRIAAKKLSAADEQSVLARIEQDKIVGLVLPAE
jgi:anti-sigma factor RsiW